MDRNIGPQFLNDPSAHTLQFVVGVILPGNDEIGNLHPDIRLTDQPAQRVTDRLDMSGRQFPVELLGKRLQVNVGRIHLLIEAFASLRRNVPRSDRDGPDSRCAAHPSRINGVLGPYNRVVVGESDAPAPVFFRRQRNYFRKSCLAERFHLPGLGNRPVLAELAAQIAAGRPERQNGGSRKEVVQRFLLDRIDTETGTPTVRGQNHTTIEILTDETEASLARRQGASARTQIADDLRTVAGVVPPSARLDSVVRNRLVRRFCNGSCHA